MAQTLRRGDLSHISQVDIGEELKSAIQSVSKNGKYQKRILAFFILVAFFTSMQNHSSNLFYMNPVFECEGFDGKITEEEACGMLDFCKIINSGTITAQLNLYCDSRKDSRTLIQTTMGFGNLLGLLLVGWFSDRKGRKLCFCVGLALLNLTWAFQFLGVHSHNIPLLLVSEFVSGVSNKMVYLSFLVILTRFLKKDGYQMGTLGWFIAANGISQMAIAGLNNFFENWKTIASVYTIGIAVCSFAAILVLREDPIFLFDTGKLRESKNVIEQIGIENGEDFKTNQQNLKKLDHTFEIKMLQIEHRLKRANNFSITEIMRCDIFQKVIIIGLAGCFYHMSNKSIELSIQSLQFSYDFNLFVVGLSNIFGFATAMYIIKVEPQRKRGFIYSSFLYCAGAMLFLFSFCKNNGTVETFVIVFLRFFLCWSCNFYTRLKIDSFPEKYQMTIVGVIQFFVNFGTIIAPTLIQASVDHGISPIASMAALRLILGTIPLFFLIQERINLLTHSLPVDQDKNEKMKEIST